VGAAASFGDPQRMTTDGTTLFVTDGGGNNTVRKIVIATGAVTTIAGTPGTAGGSDGIGAAAEFDGPAGITTDGHSLYVADTCTKAIRKID
jgi:DNA-binding beta-propeller fold protein YncE